MEEFSCMSIFDGRILMYEYLRWKNSHVCLYGKSNTWILISLLN
jgi:hypothetical protein